MKTTKLFKVYASLFSISLISIILIWTIVNLRHWENKNRIIAHDVIIYYAHLPATLIYNDLTMNYEMINNSIFFRSQNCIKAE